METITIQANGQRVGARTPDGTYLDKAAFLALAPEARPHVYLQMVYPGWRHLVCIARVCRLAQKTVWGVLNRGKTRGHIEQQGRGRYRATRAQEDAAPCN